MSQGRSLTHHPGLFPPEMSRSEIGRSLSPEEAPGISLTLGSA